MAEELNQEEGQESQQQEERTFTEEESRALNHGWVPKDQWKGDPEEWVPARVYNTKGELFKRIGQDKARIAELTQTVEALVDHNKKVYDAAYKKALDDLKAQKRVALEEGDATTVLEIDDRIEAVREQHQQAEQEFEKKVTPTRQPVNVNFDEWHANNEWYLQDEALTGYANALAKEMVQTASSSGKQIEWPKFYNEITRKVRQRFPEKFESRSPATMKQQETVSSGSDSVSDKATSRSSGLRESDLSDDERRIMNNILKTTKMSKKEYLEQMALYAERKGR